MSDKENKNEFVFEDENENNTQEYTDSSYSGSTENINTIFKNKRLMTLAGGVVAIWLLSFLLENVFGSNDKIIDKSNSSSDIKQATIELTGVDTTAEAPVDAKVSPETPNEAQDHVINKDLHDNLTSNTENIKSLQSVNETTQMQLNQLSNQMSNIAAQISNLAAANNGVSNRVAVIEAGIKAKEEAAKKAAEKIIVKKLINYNIKALISGRAWIVGPNKEYITVVIGDKLKDYGSVTEINSSQGFIATSSGRIIRFANN